MCRFLVMLFVMCASVAFAGEGDERGDHGSDQRHAPMVYDAQGGVVGPLEDYMGASGVFLEIEGSPVFVQVNHRRVGPSVYSASQFEWVGYMEVPYASSDCSGAVFVADTGSPIPAMAVREGVDVTLYIAGKVSSVDAHVGSFRYTDTSGATSCAALPLETQDLWVVKTAYRLTQHYPEPLRIGF